MSIFLFCLGLIIGFLGKLGFDLYHEFLNNQKIVNEKMTSTMAKWDLMESERAADRPSSAAK